MDWDKLKIFHAVAESGNFTKATYALNLSQSAISRQIQSLEQELKTHLFERHARGLSLTENGEYLFKTAREVISKLKDVESTLVDKKNKPISILEKPNKPKSNLIVCGLYIYDKNVVELSKNLKFSKRGELEISDLNNLYLKNNTLNVEIIDKKNHWIDAGSPEKIFEASKLIESIEKRKKSYIGFPEIAALKKRYITINDFTKLIRNYEGNHYGRILNTFLSKNFIN